ncbi:MAG: Beta-glucuronidase [Herbinix sp.]|jgi:beta-galactosidase|nr:Beta-glucuronidase [Herbinix sp.]MDF2540158.1 Beta-glucuronidase [Herbinix sp.]
MQVVKKGVVIFMRRVLLLNDNWTLKKEEKIETVNLPHCYNAIDGQDGGNDYYRGTCIYSKKIELPEVSENEKLYIEFGAVNSSADVYLNGEHLSHHDGGYSKFRVNITDSLHKGSRNEEMLLEVYVNNAENNTVYPQRADFTFYGGIYRDVQLIIVPKEHFDLDYYGAPGIEVASELLGEKAVITVRTITNGNQGKVKITIDGVGSKIVEITNNVATAIFKLEHPHLWHGRKDPYLYQATAELIITDKAVDSVSTRFGIRDFHFDKEKGFYLNGSSYPLRGVSRHQDNFEVGNAITKEMQKEDMELIADMGANTIRLAHYQHDQYFYDLCDEYGMIIWAEIPYITQHMSTANENTATQLTELIVQNYNHPSIICWGLSNEITVAGVTEDIINNHYRLNALAHKLDKTRPTAMANAFMLEIDSEVLDIPDILSYNLYYGWYMGELIDNDEWFDHFHEQNPDKVIGLAEYGADANYELHSIKPEKGDYSEEYQCLYHEHMLRMFEARPYIWSTHVWNMFDFGADGRDEGGKHGLNQKGLVSIDRKVKKDAYYLYKAYLSDQPFVHVCGSRYVDRTEEVTSVKVYSNQSEIVLYVDGQEVASQTGEKIFQFEVPISDDHIITARSEAMTDVIRIRKVSEPNETYRLASASVHNWFDEPGMEYKIGYFSIQDKLGDIKQIAEGKAIVDHMMSTMRASRGDVAEAAAGNAVIEKMLEQMTLEALIKQAGDAVKPEMVVQLNQALCQLKKPE